MGVKEQLYSYYQQSGILPTHAGFRSEADLSRYSAQRSDFFTDKLYLPPQIFRGARMVEFGPDSGENSLVFAGWGADIVLVEPNTQAHPRIREYFERFKLRPKLISLENSDLESFNTGQKFDFIDAEGFIYTVRPQSVWIELFARILQEDGFFIISYCEALGSLLELLLKLIHARAKNKSGAESPDIAWRLFGNKWDSIAHTRSFESWVMDVLDNPFVRSKYLFSASGLYSQLAGRGFRLYSSWPVYRDSLAIYWHKKELSAPERIARDREFIRRSCLSFAFGKKLFISSDSLQEAGKIGRILTQLVSLIDSSIDEFIPRACKEAKAYLRELKKFIREGDILAQSQEEKADACRLCGSIAAIFDLLSGSDLEGLVSFCNSDALFIRSWGQPYHCAVFRKVANEKLTLA